MDIFNPNNYKVSDKRPVIWVSDSKSAIRCVRGHASELGKDPERIIASGGSTVGHVVACTGVIDGFMLNENLKIS